MKEPSSLSKKANPQKKKKQPIIANQGLANFTKLKTVVAAPAQQPSDATEEAASLKRKRDGVENSWPGEKKVRNLPNMLSKDQVEKAVSALQKWIAGERASGRPKLFDDGELLYLVVSLKKIPERAKTNPYAIDIPHPLCPTDGSKEICLFVKDKDGEGHRAAKEKIASIGKGCGVTKVIGVSKLRTKYIPHEAKRKLCGSYDIFLTDDRILPLLPKLLGKTFFKKKKHPIPVKLSNSDWASQIKQACNSTFLYISTGSCCTVKVALADWSTEEVVANIMAAAAGIATHVPKKWNNIQSMYLRTAESASLPIYASLPDGPSKIPALPDVPAVKS
eukprot:TRINITY_DN17943_c0_g1_i1.p1 TRINITY_DN17943_c0_g1~~TRINITY_DN17943_c0_g1_i1.p1  ORF type:complete len:334 (-),score=89.98 TRINITY_DN17943_c0_g1_i1:25-1026(-)